MKFIIQILRRSDGNALIEVALILPVMILMLLAVADFGVILHPDLTVVDSARSAAESATSFVWTNNTASLKSIGTSSASGIPGYSITTAQYCMCAPGSAHFTCAGHSSCGAYGVPNQYIQVTATAQLPLLSLSLASPTPTT